MKTASRSREKYITLDRFLQDDHAMVHVVPTCKGVDIPAHLLSQTTVTLKISRLFRGRLTMTEEAGLEAELLFSNEYYTCKVPFDAIWAATSASGQMRMWPEDTPEEILASLSAPVGQTTKDRIEAEVDDDGEDEPGVLPDDNVPATPKRGRPTLRRIK